MVVIGALVGRILVLWHFRSVDLSYCFEYRIQEVPCPPIVMAERVGFEPTVAKATRALQARLIVHSSTSP